MSEGILIGVILGGGLVGLRWWYETSSAVGAPLTAAGDANPPEPVVGRAPGSHLGVYAALLRQWEAANVAYVDAYDEDRPGSADRALYRMADLDRRMRQELHAAALSGELDNTP